VKAVIISGIAATAKLYTAQDVVKKVTEIHAHGAV
jgi:hypothetical protein